MSKQTKILLFGQNGQVGSALRKSMNHDAKLIALGREDIDFEHPERLLPLIKEINPHIVINAAAYTEVDKAEQDVDRARTINHIAPFEIARACQTIGAWLIHYSTDYVFDGKKKEAYLETNIAHPLSIYGKTKLDGEQAIQTHCKKYLILRSSWIYGLHGSNFAKTILEKAKNHEQLNVVNDQFGTPTASDRIAEITWKILSILLSDKTEDDSLSGVYHLTANGETTWYDYAKFLVESASQMDRQFGNCAIRAILSSAYKMLANRPKRVLLNTEKLRKVFDISLPFWQVDVLSFVEHYVAEQKGEL